MVSSIEQLPNNLDHLFNSRESNEMYVKISKMLKSHQNLFILAKGSGNFVGTFMSQKFLQICNLHAEAYACAEFRHGPLSMIDEEERTPGKQL